MGDEADRIIDDGFFDLNDWDDGLEAFDQSLGHAYRRHRAMSNKGNIVVEGVQAFADLFTPGGAPGFPPKYSETIQVAKGSPSEKALFEEIQTICQKTWPDAWEAKLQAVHADIMNGVPPTDSKISLQDGDQYQPDYNGGFWVVKPSRRANQGPPQVFSIDGQPVHSADQPGCPQDGWGVSVLMNVWAMKTQSRVNFTVIAVRGVQEGVKAGGPPPAQIEAATQAFLSATAGVGAQAQAQIPGVIAPNAAVPAQAPTNTPGAVPQAAPQAPQAAVPGAAVPQAPIASPGPAQGAVPQGPPAASLGLEPEAEDEGGVITLD